MCIKNCTYLTEHTKSVVIVYFVSAKKKKEGGSTTNPVVVLFGNDVKSKVAFTPPQED